MFRSLVVTGCRSPGRKQRKLCRHFVKLQVRFQDLERHYNQTGHPTTTKLFEALTIAFMMLGRSSTLTDVIKTFGSNIFPKFSKYFFLKKLLKYFFKSLEILSSSRSGPRSRSRSWSRSSVQSMN